jgi:pyruvate kinase
MSKKILVTLGPTSLNERVVKACSDIGVYTFRINLSHTPENQISGIIDKIRQWTDTPICIDSEGAQIRNEKMSDESIQYKLGDEICIHFDTIIGDKKNISFSPREIARQMKEGDEINIDFNRVKIRIEEILDNSAIATVISGGYVASNKASDINKEVFMPPITDKDKEAIKIGLDKKIHHFALSFANKASDVSLMRELCGPEARIISKIESISALYNLEEILEVTDEILIDRGDLSRQVQIEKIPFLQRLIIKKAHTLKVPVFVATNLLESMVATKDPTRAEVNDVVSSLLMGADGLVLAAETAIGKYPIEAVEMIKRLINETERWSDDTPLDGILCENKT